jgi:hypothetical protein
MIKYDFFVDLVYDDLNPAFGRRLNMIFCYSSCGAHETVSTHPHRRCKSYFSLQKSATIIFFSVICVPSNTVCKKLLCELCVPCRTANFTAMAGGLREI